MPFSIQWEGTEELLRKMDKLPEKAAKVAAEALYEGAGVMADTVSRAVRGIATEPFKYAQGGKKRKPSPEEKQILLKARCGVSKFRSDGTEIQTSVGFAADYANVKFNHMSSKVRTNYKAKWYKGYANMTTSTLKAAGVYRRGLQDRKPVEMIANAINSGTSFMEKQPFLRKAFSTGKKAAEAAIEAGIRKREDELTLD